MIPATHLKTMGWWVWHSLLVALLCLFLLALPAVIGLLAAHEPDSGT